MMIINFIGFGILILTTLAFIVVLRQRLDLGKGAAVLVVLLLSSTIFVYITKNYIYSVPLLILSFCLPRFPVIYKIPVLSSILIFIASFLMSIIRMGIPEDRILSGIDRGMEKMLRDTGTPENDIPKIITQIKARNELKK